MSLTIRRFAETAAVGVETVRFYQRKGLLDTPDARHGIRRYDDEAVRRLRFIRKAQRAGFTLEEIRELIALDSGDDHARARALAYRRVEALDRQIEELQRSRDSLRHLADRCAHQSSGPCPILSTFGD